MEKDEVCFVCGTSLCRGWTRHAKASTRLGQWEAVAVCAGCQCRLEDGVELVTWVRGVRRLVRPYKNV